MRKKLITVFMSTAALIWPALAIAGLDRFDEEEARGIFTRSNQKRLDNLVLTGMVGTALIEGTDSKLGRTTWQAIDSTLTAAIATEAMKDIFQRPRPSQNPNPNVWFAGSGHKSFPSGEVAEMASFVTPYIYAYKDEHPAVWALAVLPVYMGKARMASQAHWLSDVLAGAAVGYATGYYAVQREQPLVLTLTGQHGVFVGWRTKF